MKTLLALCAMCAFAAPASAQFCDTNQSCFFPPGPCAYLGTEHVVFPNGWQLTYLDFENSLDCPALPPIGGSANLLDHSTFVLKLQDGGTTTLMGGSALMTMHVFVVPPNVNPREVDLELLALDLTGSFPAGVRLRESPSLASPGHMQQTEGPPGQFHITSFFDVFFELSLDGGQTWSPALGPMHTVLSPAPPLPAHGATWGGVKAIYR
jgi:hypothetical protein